MKIKTSLFLCLFALAVAALLGAPMTADAVHPDVSTMKADGSPVTLGSDLYSPKQTCGGCHFNCADGLYSTNTASYCQDSAARTAWFTAHSGAGTNCSTKGNCPDYESQATSVSQHTQGYPTSAGTVSFQTYGITAPQHGASIGLHSQHGRNETFTNAMRNIWGVPAFVAGTGMYGRY